MPAPEGKELLFIAGALVFGLVVGPALLALAIYVGVRPSYAPWIVGAYFGIFASLVGIGVTLYFIRIIQNAGAGSAVMIAIWILIALLLSALARNTLHFILR